MFRVVIDSVGDLKKLLGTTVSSSITFRIKNRKLNILVASTEVIVMYSVKTPVDEEDCSFSINRESFNRLYKSGSFSVDVIDSTVNVYFYDNDNKLTHSAEFQYIQDAEMLYASMLDVLSVGRGVEISLKDLLPMVRLAIFQQSSLQVRGGIASIILNSNFKIFKPVDVQQDFSLRFAHLRLLVNNSVVWYKMQQYICAKNDNLMYICVTDRLNDCDNEYQLVHSGYSIATKMRMDVKLAPFRDIAASHFKFDSMTLDLENRNLLLDGYVKCKFFLEISDFKKTSDFVTSSLILPKEILSVLGIFGDEVTVQHKKSFICMKGNNGVEVYFN